jgi:hypothetical protein
LTAALVTWRLSSRRQRCELLGPHHGLLVHRREAEAAGRAQQRDAVLARTLADSAHALLLAPLELRFDFLHARAVLVGLERGRDAGAQVLHQALHAAAQLRGAPRRHLEGARAVRGLEIEHVAPVRGHGAPARLLLEDAPHHRAPPDPLGPHRVQVVALAAHANAEADRAACARLPRRLRQVGEIVRGAKLELRRLAAAAELRRRQRPDGRAHGFQGITAAARRV